MNRIRSRFVIAALPCLLLLAGCAETTFEDTLGIGKSAPDESKVRTVQPLSVPPDLDLRPPAPGSVAQAGDGNTSGGSGALAAPPAGDAPAMASAGPTTSGSATGPAPAAEGSFYDIYRKHGISIYGPDGKRKKISQLNRELAEKIKEEKRRKNPNYGTIFNWGGFLK